jgi:hypothetical protein
VPGIISDVLIPGQGEQFILLIVLSFLLGRLSQTAKQRCPGHISEGVSLAGKMQHGAYTTGMPQGTHGSVLGFAVVSLKAYR